jgi:hypothetical protein
MGKTTDAIKETIAPKNNEGKIDIKRILKRWATFMALCSVVGTVWAGFSYIKDKLDAIESSTANISDMKEQNAALNGRIDQLETNLAAAINARTLATQREFAQQREVDVRLQGSVDSVRQEVRLRHGVLPADARSRVGAVRAAVAESDRAQTRTESAMPHADPFAEIGDLQ